MGSPLLVPVYEEKKKKSPPVMTFPFCAPTVPFLQRFLPFFNPVCPNLHTGCNLSVKPRRAYYLDSCLICVWMLARSFCCGFYSSFTCTASLSVFQLNVQIVNNTAVAFFGSVPVCLEEQHSSKAFYCHSVIEYYSGFDEFLPLLVVMQECPIGELCSS